MISSHELDTLVAELATVHDEELQPFVQRPSAEALFEKITAEPAQRRRLLAGRIARLSAAAAASIVAAAALVVVLDSAPPPRQASHSSVAPAT